MLSAPSAACSGEVTAESCASSAAPSEGCSSGLRSCVSSVQWCCKGGRAALALVGFREALWMEAGYTNVSRRVALLEERK